MKPSLKPATTTLPLGPLRTSSFVMAWAVLLSTLSPQLSTGLAVALGTAFTYQGRLTEGSVPADGIYDLRFEIYNLPIAGSSLVVMTNPAVLVQDGLFTTTLDFGADVFTEDARWLELGVRTNGGGAFTSLTPRQRLRPAPYAIRALHYSGAVEASQLAGTISSDNIGAGTISGAMLAPGAVGAAQLAAGAVTRDALADGAVTAAKIGDLDASKITSGTLADARLSANVALLDARQDFTGRPAFKGGTSGTDSPFTVDSTNRVDRLNADLLDGREKSMFWQVDGNGGHPTGVRFLGTTENEPIEIKVNNLRALRVEYAGDSDWDSDSDPDGAPNLIGGAPWNSVARGVVGATIAGGGATNINGVAYTNSIESDYSAIGGGWGNAIADDAEFSTVGGGRENTVASLGATIAGGSGNALGSQSGYSTIAGGKDNEISGAGQSAIGGGINNTTTGSSSTIAGGSGNSVAAGWGTIGGGEDNSIAAGSNAGIVAGGSRNEIGPESDYSAIGGGYDNMVTANAYYATIPGGKDNSATLQAFAAGTHAKANHTGSFVWADSATTDFTSFADDSVSFRCYGGVRFTGGGSAANQTVTWTRGSASWSFSSDRNLKENVAPVNSGEVLEKVARLPISEWNYQDHPQRHLGPMAQDFHALFPLNDSDTTLNSADLDGVALAAIQGLNAKVESRSRQAEDHIQKLAANNAALELEVAALKSRLARLEQLIHQFAPQNAGPR